MTSISLTVEPLQPTALRPGLGGVPWLQSLALVGAGTVLQSLRRLKMRILAIVLRLRRARTRRVSESGRVLRRPPLIDEFQLLLGFQRIDDRNFRMLPCYLKNLAPRRGRDVNQLSNGTNRG